MPYTHGNIEMRGRWRHHLFQPTSVKLALVGRVLLDVGSLPLLRSVLRRRMLDGCILNGLGIASRRFVIAIGRRYRWHMTCHRDFFQERGWEVKRYGLTASCGVRSVGCWQVSSVPRDILVDRHRRGFARAGLLPAAV